MATIETSAVCTIKIGDKEIKYNISGLQLDQFIDNHHQLQVRIRQVGQEQTDRDFDDPEKYTSMLGKLINVTITPTGEMVESSRSLEFIGVITNIDFVNEIDSLNSVMIIAESPTISMDGGLKNSQFTDVTVSDVVSSIVGNYKITKGKIESTSRKYKYIAQYWQSDYEFVKQMARRAGLFAYYNSREFCMTKASSDKSTELVWRRTLGSFRMGLKTAPRKFAAKIYNYEEKKTFDSDSEKAGSKASLGALTKSSSEASNKVFDQTAQTPSARAAEDAKGLDDSLSVEEKLALAQMAKCHGQSIVPQVTVGMSVKVTGMDKYDGQYWVKAVRHTFDESGKYHNTFISVPIEIAYPERQSVDKEIDQAEKPIVAERKVYTTQHLKERPNIGLHVAEVVDNVDPLNMGRVKVRYFGTEGLETIWVRMAVPYAGNDYGWYMLPEIGDEVVIGYEQGDPDYPIALGSLYSKMHLPPSEIPNSDNSKKIIKTINGSTFLIDEENETIQLAGKDGKTKFTIETKGPSISLECPNGSITLKSKTIAFESTTGLDLKAGGNLKIEASGNIDINASANLTAKGGAMANFEGGATANLKGALVKIN